MVVGGEEGYDNKGAPHGQSDNGDNYYAPPPSGVGGSVSVVRLRAGDTVRVWGERDHSVCGGYTDLAFSVFAWGYPLVYLGSSSSSSSSSTGVGTGTNEDVEEDGAWVHGSHYENGVVWRRDQVRDIGDCRRRGWQRGRKERE